MNTQTTQLSRFNFFTSYAISTAKKSSKTILICILFTLIILPTSVNAWEIMAIKAPSDGPEEMKKYSIVRAVEDDGYVVAGTTPCNSFLGRKSIHVLKINDNGSIDWTYYYNISNLARNFEVTHIDYNVDSNGYILGGYTDATILTSPVPYLLEISDIGTIIRNTIIPVTGVIFKVKPTPKGYYIAVGFSGDTTLLSHKLGWCIKFDNLLSTQWQYIYTGQTLSNIAIINSFFDAITCIQVLYDGTNETYVLGGNSTGVFDYIKPNSTDIHFTPIIELIELDEIGLVINRKSFYPYNLKSSIPEYGYELIVQDLVVITDSNSPYFNDVYLLAQEITINNDTLKGPEYFITISRFKRGPFSLDSEIIRLEGEVCNAHHQARGNAIQYFDNNLYVSGTLESSGFNNHVMIPFLAKINPDLPGVPSPTPGTCDPTNYPCLVFYDGTILGEEYFDGYRFQFTDYLGTSPPIPNQNGDIQVYGQRMGFIDKDSNGLFRYGIVGCKKQSLTNPFWSLYIVSNIDNNFCDAYPAYLYQEYSIYYVTDTFNVIEQSGIPSNSLFTMDQSQAMFSNDVCQNPKNDFDFLQPIDPLNPSFEEFTSFHFQNEEKIAIFPNPTESNLFFKGLALQDKIKIYDIKGQLIEDITVVSDLNEGYRLKIPGIFLIKIFRNQELVYLCKAIRY